MTYITVGLSRTLEPFMSGIDDVEKYIGRDFVFHDAEVDSVGIGQMQDFQFNGAKSVIAEILMSISGKCHNCHRLVSRDKGNNCHCKNIAAYYFSASIYPAILLQWGVAYLQHKYIEP